jgi:hypothetical protein
LDGIPGDELLGAARQRRTDPVALRRQLRGDFDAIVLKCLEKDRDRRYASASDLAADLQRHLGNEPVEARPPGTAYRLTKLVRRNKLVFFSVTAIGVALVAGLAVALALYIREKAARERAVAAEQKARK